MVEALVLAAWLYLAIGHGRFWRVRPLLATKALPSEAASRTVAVVIPARDEAETIGAAIGSLRRQQWQGTLHIVVVDDNSSDGTGAIASDAGAVVVEAGPLPPSWTGKMWALSRGVDRATSYRPDYLLFTDADIVHGRRSIERLVAIAESEGRDLVSVMVKLRCESAAERLMIPAFVFFFFLLYPPSWIAKRNRRVAGAAGGCVLIRPLSLQAAGGIEAIRDELIDDCALATAVKRSGGSLWLGLSEDTRSIRPYPRFADVWRMISRTAFTQLRYSSLLLMGTVAGLLLMYAAPVIGTLRGSLSYLLAWGTMSALYLPMIRFYRLPLWHAILLPFVAAFYMAATVGSAVNYWAGKGGGWKGRHQAYDTTGGAT